jgi:hypothetical protein
MKFKMKKKNKRVLVGIFALVGIGILVRYLVSKVGQGKSPIATGGKPGSTIMLMPPQNLTPIAYRPATAMTAQSTYANVDRS